MFKFIQNLVPKDDNRVKFNSDFQKKKNFTKI